MLQKPDESIVLPNKNEIPGLGVFTLQAGNTTYFYHTGSNVGYRCIMLGISKGEGAVIMTNSDFGNDLIPEIIRKVANTYGWEGKEHLDKLFPPLNGEVQEANQKGIKVNRDEWINNFKGSYADENYEKAIGKIDVDENGELYFQLPNPNKRPYEITPLSTHVGIFKRDGRILSIEFEKDEHGKGAVMKVFDGVRHKRI